jgi:aminoglycoside 2'-N-acetyltransferase I
VHTQDFSGPRVRGPHTARLVHTADLDNETREDARSMVIEAFDGEFTDADWEHGLGGIHALAYEGDDLVGHASVVQRRLLYDGRALRTGYVEGVAVQPDRRGHGYGAALMDELEQVIRGAYDLGALGSTDEGATFYAKRGWRAWQGKTWALTPDGPVRTDDDDGGIYVLEVGARLDLSADLTCDWRDGSLW